MAGEQQLSEVVDDGAATQATTDEGAAEAPDNQAVEAKAREMGWVPETEFKGDPARWRPADEFVQRGEEVLPIVNARARRAEARVAELEKTVSGHADTVARMERMTEVALKQQRQQIESKFEAQKREAVRLGDETAYDNAEKAQTAALKEFDTESAKPEVEKPKPGQMPARDVATLTEWKADNTWFTADRRMTAAADDHFEAIQKEMPGASMADKLAEMRARVEAEFPTKFGRKPNGNGDGARVEGGSRVAGGGAPQRGKFARLPAEVKAQADKFIKDQGLFLEKGETAAKNLPQARERYAEIYLAEEAEA
jgi:hypothetical protein